MTRSTGSKGVFHRVVRKGSYAKGKLAAQSGRRVGWAPNPKTPLSRRRRLALRYAERNAKAE